MEQYSFERHYDFAKSIGITIIDSLKSHSNSHIYSADRGGDLYTIRVGDKKDPDIARLAHVIREQRALSVLTNPPIDGIPEEYESIEKGDFLATIRRYIPGEAINDKILSARQTKGLLRIVNEAHRRGIVHLDILTGSNILIDLQKKPHLFDFGFVLFQEDISPSLFERYMLEDILNAECHQY